MAENHWMDRFLNAWFHSTESQTLKNVAPTAPFSVYLLFYDSLHHGQSHQLFWKCFYKSSNVCRNRLSYRFPNDRGILYPWEILETKNQPRTLTRSHIQNYLQIHKNTENTLAVAKHWKFVSSMIEALSIHGKFSIMLEIRLQLNIHKTFSQC